MAYFLDPELAALTTGNSRTSSLPSAGSGTQRKNRYGKSCHKCKTWVKAEAGYLGKSGGAWVVYCITCP